MGGWVFSRRKQLEYERLDRESALLALESEWAILRSAAGSDLGARASAPFVGRLTIGSGPFPDLADVRLEISCATERRIVQSGFVRIRK